MFEECNKGHTPERAKPDTRHEALETRRGWRGCRLAVTDGKKIGSSEIDIRVKATTLKTMKKEEEKERRGEGV